MRTTSAMLLLAIASGCSHPVDPPAAAGSRAPPTRIVALQCSAVDIVHALGELDRVVAVEEDCPAPGTEGKVKIRNEDHPGKLAAINVESVLALHPDAVIANPDLRLALEGRGLRILWAPAAVTMENMPKYVREIGALLGVAERAQSLLERMEEKRRALAAVTAPLHPVRVYYETTGLGWTMGGASIMDAMIRLAGGENIAGKIPKAKVTLNSEAILAADPEVIVLGPFADTVEELAKRPGWDRISAVRAGRIHRIPLDRRYVTLGTPRCVDGCEEMLLPWLHPEVARDAKER